MKFLLNSLVLSALAGSALGGSTGGLRSLQTCGAVGDRTQECGADNPLRPELCCDGLICSGIKCVDPNDLGCAAEGSRAVECGIVQANRPQFCCEGLVCNADKFCVTEGSEPVAEPTDPSVTEPVADPTDPPVAEPTVAGDVTTASDGTCGPEGDKTVECGADPKEGRAEVCCPDLICDETTRTCIAGAPTADAAPVAAPTSDVTVMDDTDGESEIGEGMSDELMDALFGDKDEAPSKDDAPPEEEPEPEPEEPEPEPEPVEEQQPVEEVPEDEPVEEVPEDEPTGPAVLGDTSICMSEGEKAVACGASPKEGRGNDCCAPLFCQWDEPICSATHPSLAVCGIAGEKVVNCGTSAKDGRPFLCCDGLYCQGDGSCGTVATGDTSFCAEVDDKAMDCGISNADGKIRAQSCCPDLYCGPDKRCAPLADNLELVPPPVVSVADDADGDKPELTIPVHPSLEICGTEGDKVVNCGASAKDGRAFLCCDGMYCATDEPMCTPVALGDTSFCAEIDEKAMDCGVPFEEGKNRAQSCCAGLYCGPEKRCIPLSENPDLAPEGEPSDTMTETSTAYFHSKNAVRSALIGCAVVPALLLL